MYSLKNTARVCIFLFCFTVVSCGLKIAEEKEQMTSMALDSVDCLSTAGDQFSEFMDGVATDENVKSTVSCISSTLRTFVSSVNGENKTYYTVAEIKRFIDKNMYKDGSKAIAESLVTDIFKFKTALVGGEDDKITKDEFRKIAMIFDSVAVDLVRLNPDMKILSGKWSFSHLSFEDKKKQFAAAAQKLNAMAVKVFAKLVNGTEKYTISEFINLSQSVLKQMGNKDELIADIDHFRNLALQIKYNLISSGEVIKNKDWPQVGYALSKVLEISLITKYFDTDEKFKTKSAQDEAHYIGYLIENIFESVSWVMTESSISDIDGDKIYAIVDQVAYVIDEKIKLDKDVVIAMTVIKDALINTQGLIVSNYNEDTTIKPWVPDDFKKVSINIGQMIDQISHYITLIDDIKNSSLNYTQFNQKTTDLENILKLMFKSIQGSIDLKYVDLIIDQIKKMDFLSDDSFFANSQKVNALLDSAVNLLLGQSTLRVSNDQLMQLAISANALYAVKLDYDKFVKPKTFGSADYLSAAKALNEKVSTVLKQVLIINPQSEWKTANIVYIFKRLKSAEVMKTQLTEDSVKSILLFLFKNILNQPSDRLAGKVLSGVNFKAVENIKSMIDQVLSNFSVDSQLILKDEIVVQTDLKKRIQSLLKMNATDELAYRNLKEIYALVNTSVGMSFDDHDELKIATGVETKYRLKDLNTSSLARSVAWLLIRSVSQSKDNIQKLTGLTEAELEDVYKLLQKTLIQLDVVSPDSDTFMKSRFMEMNLFVIHANGDSYANYNEIHDLTLHLLSGTKRSSYLIPAVLGACNPQFVQTYDRYTPVDMNCALNFLYKYKNGFDGLPDYLNFKVSHGKSISQDMYKNLLLSTGYDPKVGLMVQSLQDYPHATQYVEMLFAKYDYDRSGTLNVDEALAAFPTFKETIKQALVKSGGSVKDKKLPGVFIYFLKYGKEPKGIVEKLKFLIFISSPSKWKIDVNRHDVSKVFSFLSQ